ncbi:low affinity immunoglobulin epsilon Fc receptor-like [Glandiceps talaboti]
MWPEADQICKDKGGRLAKLANKEHDGLIHHYIIDFGIGDEVSSGFWIGLSDIDTEDTFRWLDGDRLGVCNMYSNWAPREPNNNLKRNPNGQDCVQLSKRKWYRWDDEYCDFRPKGYVCEFLDHEGCCQRHASHTLFGDEVEEELRK